MLPAYRPSGRLDEPRFALVGILGLASCAIFGAAYQIARDRIHLLWIGALFTIVVAGVVALLAGLFARAAHLRGEAAGLATGAVWGATALVGSYWLAYRSDLNAFAVGGDGSGMPGVLDYLRLRIEAGWSLGIGGERRLAGPFVVAAWLAEAALFVVAGARGALAAAREPFCETCRRYATPAWGRVVSVDASAVRRASAQGDVGTVITPPRGGGKSRSALYEIYECPACRVRSWLDVRFDLQEETFARGDASVVGSTYRASFNPWASGVAWFFSLVSDPGRSRPDAPVRAMPLDDEQAETLRRNLDARLATDCAGH